VKYYGPVITDEDYEKAAKNGISKMNVYLRVNKRGWEIERAITVPVRKKKCTTGISSGMKKLAEQNGISHTTLYKRLKSGMNHYEAVTTPKKHKKWESLIKIAQKNGISASSFYARMDRGIDPYEAATKPPRKYKKKQIS
jgi:predicted DNA-binding transcriptional regulator AlpA